jgi:hypothetical protein
VSLNVHPPRPDTKLVGSISELGAIIVSLAYGISVGEKYNRYIETAEAAVSTYVLSVLLE